MDAARFDVLDWPLEETDAFPVRGTPGGHHDWWEGADESPTIQAQHAAEDAAMQWAIEQDREMDAPRSRTSDQPTL